MSVRVPYLLTISVSILPDLLLSRRESTSTRPDGSTDGNAIRLDHVAARRHRPDRRRPSVSPYAASSVAERSSRIAAITSSLSDPVSVAVPHTSSGSPTISSVSATPDEFPCSNCSSGKSYACARDCLYQVVRLGFRTRSSPPFGHNHASEHGARARRVLVATAFADRPGCGHAPNSRFARPVPTHR